MQDLAAGIFLAALLFGALAIAWVVLNVAMAAVTGLTMVMP